MANKSVSFYGAGNPISPQDPATMEYARRMKMAQAMGGGFDASPANPMQGLSRVLRSGLSAYTEDSAQKELDAKQKAGSAEIMKVLQAYQQTGGQPAYDAALNRQMDVDETSDDVDSDALAAYAKPGGMTAALAVPTETTQGDQAKFAMMQNEMVQQQAIAAEQRALADKRTLKQTPGGPNSPTGRPSASIQISDKYDEIVASHGQAAADVWLRRFGNTGTVDAGGKIVFRVDAANPNAPAGAPEVTRTPNPEQMPAFKAAVKTAEANATADAEIRQEYAKKGVKSKQALDALVGVEDMINKSTGSWGGTAFNALAAVFGHAPEGAINVGKLKVLQANLMLSQPRMEGPQSDKDVQLYREAAGQIGDPTVPNPIKLAAVDTIRALHKKYIKVAPRATAAPANVDDKVNRALKKYGD